MVHAETETLSRPTVRRAPAPQPSVQDDTALLAACREFDKQRRRAIAKGTTAGTQLYDLRQTIRTTEAVTEDGAAARLRIIQPVVPPLALTGTNTALDAAVERIRELMAAEEVAGRAHTDTENALLDNNTTRAARAEAKANRTYIAAQDATEAARDALLDVEVSTLREAQTRLHAYAQAVAHYTLPSLLWREMDYEEAVKTIWASSFNVPVLADGLATYAKDVERLTAAPTPTDPSGWDAAHARCEQAEAVLNKACEGDDRAEIVAARDAFLVAREALFAIPAPNLAALAQKIAAHSEAPALGSPADLAWHLERGDDTEKMWASLVVDARTLADKQRAQTVASPILASLAAEFERRWAIEEQAYNNPDDPDPDATAEHLVDQTYAMVRQIEAQPAVTLGDFAVRARLVAWGWSGGDEMRRQLDPTIYGRGRGDQLTLDLLTDLQKFAPAPAGTCAAADLLPAFRAAYATRDTDFAAEERIAEQVCKTEASSLTGVLFQFSIAHRFLAMSNDFEHCPNQEALFQLGQTALLNAARSLSRITGMRLRESGWDMNDHAQLAGLPL